MNDAPFLRRLLAPAVLLAASALSPLVLANVQLTAPAFIVIQRDLDTGAYSYESPFSSCASTSTSSGVTVQCVLGTVAGVPERCKQVDAVQVTAASTTHTITGTATCAADGYYPAWASCGTDPVGPNTVVCAGVYPDPLSGFPPGNKASCRSAESEASPLRSSTLSDGAYTVTCLYA